jgi:hypothetical protein
VGWLIDTNLWIAVERGALAAADIHAITRQEPIYLSPINIAEIQFGLEMLPPGAKKQNARPRQHHQHRQRLRSFRWGLPLCLHCGQGRGRPADPAGCS